MVHPHVSTHYVELIDQSFDAALQEPLLETEPAERVMLLRDTHVDVFSSCFEARPVDARIAVWDYETQDEVTIDPYEYGVRLVNAAYYDLHSLTTKAEPLISQVAPRAEVAPQLIASRGLLRVASITDPHKELVTELLLSPYEPYIRKTFNEPSGAMLQHLTTSSVPRVAWSPGVDAWIRARSERNVGCPAGRITHNDERYPASSLLHHFWNRVIQRAYADTN